MIHITVYHTIANGLVERFHRQLKSTLKSNTKSDLWMKSLPLILLGIRTALKENIHCTAAELIYVFFCSHFCGMSGCCRNKEICLLFFGLFVHIFCVCHRLCHDNWMCAIDGLRDFLVILFEYSLPPNEVDPLYYVSQLKTIMQSLQLVPPCMHNAQFILVRT